MRILRFPSLPSTNAHLLALAEAGAAAGTAVMADRQTEGRGRSGRTWHSPPGNLHLSVLLRPSLPPRLLPRLPLLASLGLLDALDRTTAPLGIPFSLKWPNDILVEGRKAAGLLLEARTAGERVEAVVVGAGVNLAPREAFPPGLAERAVSLDRYGSWEREDLARRFLSALLEMDGAWEGERWEEARAKWWARAWRPAALTVRGPQGELTGPPLGLDPDGLLLVGTAAGPRSSSSGEVVTTHGE